VSNELRVERVGSPILRVRRDTLQCKGGPLGIGEQVFPSEEG
jgi:hypothetical protein